MSSYPITLDDCLWMYYYWNFTTIIQHGVITGFILEDSNMEED